MSEQDFIDMVADAGNPETPAERLHDIYFMVLNIVPFEHQAMLFAALGRNPNTPPEHIEWIAMSQPEDVLDNPALHLLILEDPTFPQSSVAVERMAKFPHCPEVIKRRARITQEQHQEAEEAGRSLYDYRGKRYTP